VDELDLMHYGATSITTRRAEQNTARDLLRCGQGGRVFRRAVAGLRKRSRATSDFRCCWPVGSGRVLVRCQTQRARDVEEASLARVKLSAGRRAAARASERN